MSFELSEYTVREAMGSVEVCVHVESGVLQSGIEAVVTVEATALQQEGTHSIIHAVFNKTLSLVCMDQPTAHSAHPNC